MLHTHHFAPLMSRRARIALLVAAGVSFVGCGNAAYSFEILRAERRIEEARELKAEERAPYEYYYARAHYEKARTEAAEADYGDAIDFASTSSDYATQAIKKSRAAQGARP